MSKWAAGCFRRKGRGADRPFNTWARRGVRPIGSCGVIPVRDTDFSAAVKPNIATSEHRNNPFCERRFSSDLGDFTKELWISQRGDISGVNTLQAPICEYNLERVTDTEINCIYCGLGSKSSRSEQYLLFFGKKISIVKYVAAINW